MEIYFDNSATTICSDGVIKLMEKVYREDYGNPSSLHTKGFQAENYIKEARKRISRTLKVKETELIFTSGGTESDNLAIIGCAFANSRAGKHLITTEIEHPAVLAPMKFLEQQGFSVTYLKVDKFGRISLEELEQSITPETILVSIMYVNNEIGAMQPIEEAAKIIKEKNPNTLFHVDAIQAYGKYFIYPEKMKIDLLSVSGHKIHGPKGVGFLYKKDKVKINPLMLGGGHQNGLRSGTENVPGIAGMGQAALEAYESLGKNREHLWNLRQHFLEGLLQIPQAHINGSLEKEKIAAHIVSVSFEKVAAEVLLHALEDKGIYVSAGSACASNKPEISKTLKSIGLKQEYLTTTIRFSFSSSNTLEEVDTCIDTLKELVPILSKYTRR